MEREAVSQAIRSEMNRRRRYAGADDVPVFLWEAAEVRAAVQEAVACAGEEGFDGNWDYASTGLDDKMEALAKTLRRKSVQQRVLLPVTDAAGANDRRPLWASQDRLHGQGGSEDGVGYHYFPYFPSVTRQDAGGHALADYLSWHWQTHGWSAFVCKQVCGGEYLTREEAWEFLTSGLPKVLGYEDYERLGLCPARTTGRILSKYLKVDGLLFMTNMAMVDPKTRQVTATTDTLFSKTGHYCVEINLPKGDSKTRRLKRLVLHLSEDRYHYVTSRDTVPGSYHVEYGHGRDWYIAPHPAPYFQGQQRYVEGYASSVMADLIGTAEMFSGQYMVSIWDMLEACLTGRFPPQPAVTISSSEQEVVSDVGPDEFSSGKARTGFSAQGPASLTVQPWVTPEVLADAWREHRKGNPCYSPTVKQAETLRFVLTHTAPGQEFEWESLAERWQTERGELMTRGQLYKQFQRAQAAVLPGYTKV